MMQFIQYPHIRKFTIVMLRKEGYDFIGDKLYTASDVFQHDVMGVIGQMLLKPEWNKENTVIDIWEQD